MARGRDRGDGVRSGARLTRSLFPRVDRDRGSSSSIAAGAGCGRSGTPAFARNARLRWRSRPRRPNAPRPRSRASSASSSAGGPARARAKPSPAPSVCLDRIEQAEVNRTAKSLAFGFPPVAASGRVVLEAQGLRVAVGDRILIDGADVVIERGERVAMVAERGGQDDPARDADRTASTGRGPRQRRP